MDDELRHLVIETLRRGEDLPREWARALFPPEKREYELVYAGKEREEDILAGTMAVPLQRVNTFAGLNPTDPADWTNMLIFGDNLQALRRLVEMKQSGKLCNADGTPGVRLVYIDPPFATRQEFRGAQEQKAYQDKIAGAAFLEYLRKRLVLLRELLSGDGSVYLHLDQRKSHYLKVIMDEVFGEHNFRNEIIWRNTNSHSSAETFGNIHQAIYLYSRSTSVKFFKYRRPPFRKYVEQNFQEEENGNFYSKTDLTASGVRSGESGEPWRGYNPTDRGRHWAIASFVYDLLDEDIQDWPMMQKLDYLYEKGLVYIPDKEGGQPRIMRLLTGEVGNYLMDLWAYQPYTQGIYLDSGEGIDEDVSWAISKNERTGYPTQKPEGLLNRIIQSSSQPGDLVLDAFAGSGTTCAVAEKSGRRWIGIDAGKLAIYTIQKRLLNLREQIGNQGQALAPRPFTLYNAGLYDFETLRKLPWDDWRFFALQLFECKDEPHTIGGFHFDGKRQGSSAVVFDFHRTPDARVDEASILEIHRAVGRQVGRRVYIIAPRNLFDFQQDYLTFDDVRYYALRIPYSFIGELHRREFAALHQPKDENAVNELMDAVGFDFIRPPHVVWEAGTAARAGRLIPEAYLDLREFESRAYIRGQDTSGGLETFSMLMLDFAYDAAATPPVFDFSTVFFAQQLASADWRAWFPLEGLGAQVMAVFVDIYGNEARELIPRAQFEKKT